jgi:hypothetical protein
MLPPAQLMASGSRDSGSRTAFLVGGNISLIDPGPLDESQVNTPGRLRLSLQQRRRPQSSHDYCTSREITERRLLNNVDYRHRVFHIDAYVIVRDRCLCVYIL